MLIMYSECSRPVIPSPAERESVSGTRARFAQRPGAQPSPNAGGTKIKGAKCCPFELLLAPAIPGKHEKALPKREWSARRVLRTAARIPSFCLRSKSFSCLRGVGRLLDHTAARERVRARQSWGGRITSPVFWVRSSVG